MVGPAGAGSYFEQGCQRCGRILLGSHCQGAFHLDRYIYIDQIFEY